MYLCTFLKVGCKIQACWLGTGFPEAGISLLLSVYYFCTSPVATDGLLPTTIYTLFIWKPRAIYHKPYRGKDNGEIFFKIFFLQICFLYQFGKFVVSTCCFVVSSLSV